MAGPTDSIVQQERTSVLLGRAYSFTTVAQAGLDYTILEQRRIRLMIDLRGRDRLEISMLANADREIMEMAAILTHERSIGLNLTGGQQSAISMPAPTVMNQQYNFLINEMQRKLESFFQVDDPGRAALSTGY